MAATHVRIGVIKREYEEMVSEMQQAETQYRQHNGNGNKEIAQYWYGQYFVLKSHTERLAERFGFQPTAAS